MSRLLGNRVWLRRFWGLAVSVLFASVLKHVASSFGRLFRLFDTRAHRLVVTILILANCLSSCSHGPLTLAFTLRNLVVVTVTDLWLSRSALWFFVAASAMIVIVIVVTASNAVSVVLWGGLALESRSIEVWCVLWQHLETYKVGVFMSDHGTIHKDVVLLVHQLLKWVHVERPTHAHEELRVLQVWVEFVESLGLCAVGQV